MAETQVVAVSLKVDAGDSVKSIKEVEKEISALKDGMDEVNRHNHTHKEELLKLTQAYAKLPKVALAGRKHIKDQMDVLSRAIKEDNLALSKFRIKKAQKQKLISDLKTIKQEGKNTTKALGDVAMTMASGYQAFIGVSALVGADNEDLMKQLVKLQGVTTTLMAVEKLRNDLSKEGSLTKAFAIAKTKIMTATQWLYNGSIEAGTRSLSKIKVAMMSTGIGALIIGIGMLIANWDKWTSLIGKSNTNLKLSNDIKEKSTESTYKEVSALDSLQKSLKKVGGNRKDENRLVAQFQKDHPELLKGIDAEKLSTEELNKQIGIQTQLIQLRANVQAVADLRAEEFKKQLIAKSEASVTTGDVLGSGKSILAVGKFYAKELLGMEQNYGEFSSAVIKNTDERLSSEKDVSDKKLAFLDAETVRQNELIEETLKGSLIVTDAITTKDSKIVKSAEDRDALLLQLQRDLADLIIANEEDEDVRRLARLQLDQERALEDLRLKYGLETELEKELLIKQNTDLNELKQEIFLKNQEEGAKILEEILELEEEENPIIEKMRGEALTELEILRARLEAGLLTEKEYAKKTQAIYDAKHLMRKAELDNAGSISSSLASLFAKNEKIQKANALVQIGIDTAKAISALVAQSNGNPMNLVTGGLAGFAQLATGLASIAGNVAKAKQLLSGGGGSITGGSGVTPPSFDTSTINSRSTNGDGSGDGTISTNRVVLVESDLRMMQERRNNSEIISTI